MIDPKLNENQRALVKWMKQMSAQRKKGQPMWIVGRGFLEEIEKELRDD